MKRIVLGITVAIVTLAIAAAATAGVPDKGRPIANRFAADGYLLSMNLEQSRYVARLAAGLGFNGMRTDLVWHPDSRDPSKGFLSEDDQLTAVCNAAQAVTEAGMTRLLVNIRPGATRWPQVDDDPASDNDRRALTEYAMAVYSVLERPTTDVSGKPGCVTDKPLIVLIQIGNEANLTTFCQPQSDTDHKACAANYILEAAYSYKRLHAEATSYGSQVTVVGCDLASHHTPLGFNQAVKNVIKANRLKGPFWDLCDYHPYTLLGSQDPMSGFAGINQLRASLMDTYGRSGPIGYLEVGYRTVVPNGQDYIGPPNGALAFPESQIASVWAEAFSMARQQGITWFGVFQVIDQCRLLDGWQSGQYYCKKDLNPTAANPAIPKSSLPGFRQALLSVAQP